MTSRLSFFLSDSIVLILRCWLQYFTSFFVTIYRSLMSISPFSFLRSFLPAPISCDQMLQYVLWRFHTFCVWGVAIPSINVLNVLAGSHMLNCAFTWELSYVNASFSSICKHLWRDLRSVICDFAPLRHLNMCCRGKSSPCICRGHWGCHMLHCEGFDVAYITLNGSSALSVSSVCDAFAFWISQLRQQSVNKEVLFTIRMQRALDSRVKVELVGCMGSWELFVHLFA